ncbi:MAG: Uma2 family endonuclease [Gemmatimonadetes bacterium]|nr:Uma2 family endonuclease [Gemmatimonadota bacterium]
MPHASPPRWTRAMVEALPEDGQRYELAYGELLVTPAPGRRHERILLRFFRAIDTFVTAEGLGELFVSHGVVSWDDASYFLPDLLVVPASESHTDDWAEVQHPLLIIEVLSPSSARHDRVQKRRRFQEAGVPLYGIVDPGAGAGGGLDAGPPSPASAGPPHLAPGRRRRAAHPRPPHPLHPALSASSPRSPRPIPRRNRMAARGGAAVRRLKPGRVPA